MKKVLAVIGIIVVLVVAGIQFVPVERSNPPVKAPFSSPPDVQAVFRQSCYDCHSNETKWPWYSHVAPVSWLLSSDVTHARKKLNFSDWGTYSEDEQSNKAAEIYSETHEGGMPKPTYLLMHPMAKLDSADLSTIAKWANELAPGVVDDSSNSSDEDKEKEKD